MDMSMEGFIKAFSGFFLFSIVMSFIFYCVAAFARYKYLRVRNYENSWLALIPLVNVWALVEATYGRRERINIYGWDAPATVLKLWPIVTYIAAIVINVIPFIGNILSILLSILNIAVLAMIFKDMMEHLEKPQETIVAVIAVIIHIVADIMLITACGNFEPGQQNWQEDNREPGSQTAIGGPLAFLNKKL